MMTLRQIEIDRRKTYAEQVLDPARWIASAQDLLTMARLVEHDLRTRWRSFATTSDPDGTTIHTVYLMLIGFAVENLLKSRIVKYDRKLWRTRILKDGRLPKELKENHNLVALARRAHLRLIVNDEVTLRRLTRYAQWAGRYPVPVDCGKLTGLETLEDGTVQLVDFQMESDLKELPKLIEALAAKFRISAILSLAGAPASQVVI
jgi:hypothetical protein